VRDHELVDVAGAVLGFGLKCMAVQRRDAEHVEEARRHRHQRNRLRRVPGA
jgi:hypothetical protein